MHSERCINFSPGPAGLPLSVLEKAHAEWFNWQQQGASIIELSHRHPAFITFAEQTEAKLRTLLNIPDNMRIIMMQGGARMQYAMLPLNCRDGDKPMAYVDSGLWSHKAWQEAETIGQIKVIGRDSNYHQLPQFEPHELEQPLSYVHYVTNETVHGLAFHQPPIVPTDVQLIADMTSDLLTKPIDASQFDCIYAATQKNLGVSGLTVVIIKDSLIARAPSDIPQVWQYRSHAQAQSLWLTPNTFGWYIFGLMLDWIEENGGLAAQAQRNQRKAETLYQVIDQYDCYQNPVNKNCRSTINAVFRLPSEALEQTFLEQSEAAGMLGLKGHFAVGGLRASLYNAVSQADVDRLAEFMCEFAEKLPA